MKINKQLRYTILTLAALIPLGLATKWYRGPAAGWVNDSLGGVLYVVFWCAAAALIFRFIPAGKIASGVVAFTSALEVMQLWHPGFLEYLRSFFIGRALLGTTFSWLDFPHYLAGGLIGWWMVRRLQAG